MSDHSPHRRSRSSLGNCPGSLSIVAQRVDGQWALLLWWDASLPHKVLGSTGRERRWSRLSSALEFATRRYPWVYSYQLVWPARWLPGKARTSQRSMVRSSLIAERPSPPR